MSEINWKKPIEYYLAHAWWPAKVISSETDKDGKWYCIQVNVGAYVTCRVIYIRDANINLRNKSVKTKTVKVYVILFSDGDMSEGDTDYDQVKDSFDEFMSYYTDDPLEAPEPLEIRTIEWEIEDRGT